MRLMINSDVTPTAYHSPIPVPLHWHDAVKAGLEKDVRLVILKPGLIEDPVTWYHRMVICAKNGTPTRTIDFQPLNLHDTRETQHSVTFPLSENGLSRKEDCLRCTEQLPQHSTTPQQPTLYHIYHTLGLLQILHSPTRLHCLGSRIHYKEQWYHLYHLSQKQMCG